MHRESHLHNPPPDPDPDPIRLADYSRRADVSTQLIDVGDGTKDADCGGSAQN
jgi:hypothetical protein